MTQLRTKKSDAIELVLGGGGIKGFGHIGVLQALEDRHIQVGRITGVSVGSLVAALYRNGFSPAQIQETFLRRLPERFNPTLWMQSLTPVDPVALIFGSVFNLLPSMRAYVRQQKLVPSENLAVVAYDVVRRQPFVFQGTGYDLAQALAASCALPGVFRPVATSDRKGLLVDGALYHRNPTEFCSDAPVLVSRLGLASEMPREPLNPVDTWYHLREMYVPFPTQRADVDDCKHVLIDLNTPDIAGLSFGRSQRTLLSMVDNGYRVPLLPSMKASNLGAYRFWARRHRDKEKYAQRQKRHRHRLDKRHRFGDR